MFKNSMMYSTSYNKFNTLRMLLWVGSNQITYCYCKTGNVGQQLSLTKLTMPVESLNFVSVLSRPF